MRTSSAVPALWTEDGGVTTAEYALLLAVIVLSTIVAFSQTSESVQNVVNRASSALASVMGSGCAG